MFEFHTDKPRYFQYQYYTARDYIYPLVGKHLDLSRPIRVLEIGCAEAGVLKAFLEKGHNCTGIELSPSRVELARVFLANEIGEGRAEIISRNIYDFDPERELPVKYDLVILKDVIEHIPDHARFLKALRGFIHDKGMIFFAFPPWQMPFGGHQQLCASRLLSKWPWLHLLPKPVYAWVLRLFGEPKHKYDELLEIHDTRISIEGFQRLSAATGFVVSDRVLYILNPIYTWKFGWKPMKQLPLLRSIPWLRNFVTTCAYFLISPK